MHAKKIAVVFYRGEVGAEPVREWLKSLEKPDRAAIGDDIRTVEFGWPVGMPVCRPLGRGLYEVRTRLRDRTARMLFAIVGNDMVLLHGFIKKSRKTPSVDLDLARARLNNYRRPL
ncbi:MAG TPA: type II toxin-antitoxin system RelE/ParE family toxin [Rhizomicrobium sp.]|jgi:phage-related protein